MYQSLSVFSGILLAVMVFLNGGLAEYIGSFNAAVIIHMVGSLFAFGLYRMKKEKEALFKFKPRWLYLGGVIGVATTVLTNLSFGKISMTSIVALGLLGQTITSLVIDRWGLFGMPKRSFKIYSFLALVFSIAGVFVMMDSLAGSGILAMLFAFVSGISVIVARTINGELAKEVGPLGGSLVNHLMGLPVTILLAFLARETIPTISLSNSFSSWWIYLGGIFGVLFVGLTNSIVPKVSAFQVTILTFIGQIFTGIILDQLLVNSFSNASFQGGMIISVGMIINIVGGKLAEEKVGIKINS